jgi:hypothetical protein
MTARGEELLDDYITEDGEPLTMADALEFVDTVNRYGHMASAEELELARELASVFHGHMEETQAAKHRSTPRRAPAS